MNNIKYLLFGGKPQNGTFNMNVIGTDDASHFFHGLIDEIQVYNRTLSEKEVATLYYIGDSEFYSNYYTFQETGQESMMLICAQNNSSSYKNRSFINCTCFFENNQLIFYSNDSSVINIWTNLGQPVSISNGVWNSENFTATLDFNASSVGVLDWNPNTPPFASNISVSSLYAGNSPLLFQLGGMTIKV